MRSSSRILGLCLALLAGGLCASPATADSARGAAYAELLADPGNVEKNLAYARILVAEGDFEGAIAVLERLGLLYPQQPKIEFELAVAYYRLGSLARAEAGFARIVANPQADPQQIARARQFLDRLQVSLSPHRFTGSLFAGLRFDSNANAGTRNNEILVFDTEIDRPKRGKPNADLTALMGGRLDFARDFEQQNGLALEGNVGLQGEKHIDVMQLDRLRLDGALGLGFAPDADLGNRLRLRPYVDLALEMRDGEFYSVAGGPGLGLTAIPSSDWKLGAAYEFWLRDFQQVEELGDTEIYSGHEHRLRANAAWALRPGTIVSAAIGYRRTNAQREYLDSQSASLALGLAQDYASPLPGLADWRIGLSLAHEMRWYDDADDNIDGDIERRDHVWRIGLTNTIPLGADWSLIHQVALTHTDSNLPNFEFDNVETSLLFSWQF